MLTLWLATGSFFLIYGLWWMFETYWIHLTQKKSPKLDRNSTPTRSGLLRIFDHDQNDPLVHKSWIPQPFLKRIPLEPIGKVIFPALGVFVELFLNVQFDKDSKSHLVLWHYQVKFYNHYGTFGDLNRFYHICLYSSFVLSGIVDLLSLCSKLPRAVSQLFLCFAFYSETILFSFHIHGRDPFNSAVHQFLLIFVMSCALFATLRMLNPRNLFINAGLAGSLVLQGTQLIQAGWVLYGGTQWNLQSHENIKFISALAIWHMLGAGIFMLVTFIIMRAVFNQLAKSKWCVTFSLKSNEHEREMESLISRAEDNTISGEINEDKEELSRVKESQA